MEFLAIGNYQHGPSTPFFFFLDVFKCQYEVKQMILTLILNMNNTHEPLKRDRLVSASKIVISIERNVGGGV